MNAQAGSQGLRTGSVGMLILGLIEDRAPQPSTRPASHSRACVSAARVPRLQNVVT